MIIQELTISFADQKAPKLTSRYGEEGRQYLFTPDQEIPDGASVVLQIVKPDRNFVIDNASITEDKILVTIPQQASVVKGIAYYNIEVQKSGLIIYSAEGEIWVDDALIDDSMIESISEVFGYKFPDDFITDDKIVPLIINDSVTGTTTTWSSSFIQEKISEIQPGSSVVVNPTDPATATAETIKVDGTTYDFPTYSDVEVNPSDTASATMETIKVDGTTYDLPTYPESLAELDDTSIVNPADGDLLTYDSLTGKWINDASPAAPDLDDLGDVDITTPTDGDILQYDDIDNTWKNSQLPPIPPVSTVVAGNPIEIQDSAAAPLVRCETVIQGYQEGSGTPSPDNVRTIVAYNQSTISVEDENEVVQQTSTATFSKAIYQGNADFVGGKVTSEWVVEDLSTYTWGLISGNRWHTGDKPIIKPFDGTTVFAIFDSFGTVLPSELYNDQTLIGGTVTATCDVIIRNGSTTNPPTGYIAYKLATPTTETITPTNLPIKSLFGYNHIESSTGEMEVEYINQRYQPILDAAAIMIGNNVTSLRSTPAPVQSIQREELQPISLEERIKESAELADLTEEEEEENDYED